MKVKVFASTAPVFSKLQDLAVVMQTGTKSEILAALQVIKVSPLFAGKKGWFKAFTKLEALIISGAPQFKVFAKGNSKLPFFAFSILPGGVSCPGAGPCLDFCYSFRAWRYPSAFARQCQNTLLMRFDKPVISAALAKIPGSFDFRLFVDGDFENMASVEFWMNEFKNNPQIKAYGYSKSFALLLGYNIVNTWPTNYALNVSSGHNASQAMVDYVKELPITRGEFVAVKIGFKPVHGSVETNAAIRAQFDEKIFPCPGQCGACTGAGHACGMPKMKHRIIAIAIH